MSNWIDIGRLDDIAKRGARVVKTTYGCVAVFRTGTDEVFALNSACPHKAGPLADGIVHGNTVTCPLHSWVISLETGAVQGDDQGQVATYPTQVQAGRILIDASFLKSRNAA